MENRREIKKKIEWRKGERMSGWDKERLRRRKKKRRINKTQRKVTKKD